MKAFCLVVFLTLVFSSSAQAEPASIPSIDSYGSIPDKSMLVISSTGNRMAYRTTSKDKDYMVIFDLKKNKMITAVDIADINPGYAYFINDNQLIFVASVRKKLWGYRGDRHNISAAYVYNIDNKDIHPLLNPGRGVYRGQTALGRISGLSADGRYAYMPAWENPGRYSLMKVNLEKQRTPRVFVKGRSDVIDYFVGTKDNVLARERYNNETNIHRIEAYKNNEWVEIFKEEVPYRTKSFTGITPDENNLVMIKQDKAHGRFAYYTMSLKGGALSEPVFSHPNKDVESVISDTRRVVHGVRYSGFLPSYEFFNQELNSSVDGVIKSMPGNSFTIVSHTSDWKGIVFYVEGDGTSGDYYFYRNGEFVQLAAARKGISPEQVHQVSQLKLKARDGLMIPTLLTLPHTPELKNLPSIMLPHGGPEAYDKIGFNWLAQYFASRGFLVIQPQFRGSKGFGAEHLLKGRGEWGRKMQDDLTDTLNKLINVGYVDPEKVCIVGASYGGYAAVAGATFTPDLYQCAVSINGVADIPNFISKRRLKLGSDHSVISYWQDVIAKGEFNEEHMKQISPVHYAKNISIPILMIHGTDDEVVPIEQSEDMVDALENANKSVEFIKLKNGNHYLSKNVNRLKTLKAINKFIQVNIGS